MESVYYKPSRAKYGQIITDQFSHLTVPHQLGEHNYVPVAKLMTNSGRFFRIFLSKADWKFATCAIEFYI